MSVPVRPSAPRVWASWPPPVGAAMPRPRSLTRRWSPVVPRVYVPPRLIAPGVLKPTLVPVVSVMVLLARAALAIARTVKTPVLERANVAPEPLSAWVTHCVPEPISRFPPVAVVLPSAVPLRAVTVAASVPLVVTSPERLPLVMVVAPENCVRLPLAGEPVVETVPPPPPAPQAALVPAMTTVPLLSISRHLLLTGAVADVVATFVPEPRALRALVGTGRAPACCVHVVAEVARYEAPVSAVKRLSPACRPETGASG